MGNIGITLSRADPAGETMLCIFSEREFKETDSPDVLRRDNLILLTINPLIVPDERYRVPPEPNPYPADYDALAKKYDIDYIIVASRHWARSGQPSLTVHPTGNFGKAMYGGRPRELQATLANPMRDVFFEMNKNPPKGFKVSLEATHHSPTQFNIPMFFAEVGSSEKQWRRKDVCEYLVDSILNGIQLKGNRPVAIGFGGGHYCPTFTSKMKDTAFGHIAAKYALDLLNDELVEQMAEKTLDGVNGAIIDNGTKGYQKKKVEVALKKLEIPLLE